jgi:hypothetical protein
MENSQSPIIKKTNWTKRITIALVLLLTIFICFVYICGITYSEGSRTGIAIKVSKKGYLFKTHEGTLNLGGISSENGNLMPMKIWDFSIAKNDTAVFNKITSTQGKEVRLYYKEVIKTFFWQGDTKYYIYKVEVVN